jgi:alpha-methylacyl-CoA racemase
MDRPLAGIGVVTTAVNVPGPAAAARLLELGAAVTKVEPPDGDPLELASPEWYRELAAGQNVIRLDLKEQKGRAAFDDLLAGADLLLTSQRPSALRRLGVSARNGMCHVAIVGYSEPDQELVGHDLTYAAGQGLLTLPELPRTLVADLGGAERAVTAALALLLARKGGYAEVSLAEAAEAFAAPLRHGLTRPGGALAGGLAVYGVYESQEGWVAVAALEPRFQDGLRRELGLDELTREALSDAFRARAGDDWERWARDRDLPIAAVKED